MKRLIYAGIGSRETPDPILELMEDIGRTMARDGWVLRSGRAQGADTAFEVGALQMHGQMEIFLPWKDFNRAPGYDNRYIIPEMNIELATIAARYHPAWDRCSNAARKLHMRNVCQMLGANMDDPCKLVICWTHKGLGKGGTGQALRIAEAYGIPIFDLGKPFTPDEFEKAIKTLSEYVDGIEAQYK